MVKRLFLASVIAAAACTFPEQPLPAGERQIVVHAVLDPSLRFQTINLSITEGTKVTPGELNDAAVSITTPDGIKLFARQDSVRDSTGKFLYVLPNYRIDLQAVGVSLAPGGSYTLMVVDRSGQTVTGATTIPAVAPASLPTPIPFDRSHDTLQLVWSRVPGARTYEVQVWATSTYTYGKFTSIRTNLRQSTFADTSVVFAGTAKSWDDNDLFPFNDDPYEHFTVRVTAYAVDDNYYEYYRLLGDPYIGAAPSRLKGGLGVFGSVVPVVQRHVSVK